MKIIKKLFLSMLMLLTFASCTSTVNLKNSAAAIKPSQKKVIIASYPKNHREVRATMETNFKYDGWKITNISFHDTHNIDPKEREEPFLVVIDKVYKNRESLLFGTDYYGGIVVFDLRTGNVIIDYELRGEDIYTVTNSIVKTLNKLVVK